MRSVFRARYALVAAAAFCLSTVSMSTASMAESASGPLRAASTVNVVSYSSAAGFDGDAGSDSADAEKKICRDAAETGSRLRKKRTCKTAAEWDEANRAARDASDNIQRQTEKLRAPNPSASGG